MAANDMTSARLDRAWPGVPYGEHDEAKAHRLDWGVLTDVSVTMRCSGRPEQRAPAEDRKHVDHDAGRGRSISPRVEQRS